MCLSSEREPPYQDALPRIVVLSGGEARGDDSSEAGAGIAVRLRRLRQLEIREVGAGGVRPTSAVEHVGEFDSEIEACFFCDSEPPAQIHVFNRTVLPPVIVVVGG